MKLGQNLVSICKERKMSLSQLAKKSGVPVQTLHGWTTGKAVSDLRQLKKVAGTLRISLHRLAFGECDPFELSSDEVLHELFSGDVRVTLHKIQRRSAL